MNGEVHYDIYIQIIKLLVFDAVVASLLLALLLVLKFSKSATYAVTKRNFFAYFSNPTGYVFICVFVFLCSVAAFWSQGFFDDNLATLDELNGWFPYIMLLFVPAITMSIWAAERNEGTDELLLTIPASDADIVLGKYAAAAAIYTVSLLISQITIFIILDLLAQGDVDLPLFISTYVGYWCIGLAMIAIGMSASFLTGNLTVAFILGALFNAPLVCLTLADRWISDRDVAQTLSSWSIASRFQDFGRGVIGLASASFFVLIIVLGAYLSMIFIGRRHWLGGRDGRSLLPHFVVRGMALAVFALFASKFLAQHDVVRWDTSADNVNSVSLDSAKIIDGMANDQQVLVEAFISKSVHPQFIQTKTDLLNLLRAFDLRGGNKIEVRINDDMEPYTNDAKRAKDQYGIEPVRMPFYGQNKVQEEDLFLAVAMTKGLQRVIVPFFHRGVPVEYELVRSLAAVNNAKRKRIGIARTDAELFGGFDMQTGQRPKERIVEELEKQYDVEQVDLTAPVVAGKYDVLIAVQPSSLPQPQLTNLMNAIRSGQPTAIFEDPMPYFFGNVPSTGEPRRPPGGMMAQMMGGGRPPEPKGNFRGLWELLGVEMLGSDGVPTGMDGSAFNAEIVWQAFNPYREKIQVADVSPEWVFVSPQAPGAETDAFNPKDTVTSGLGEVLLLYPGAIRDIGARGLTFTPLMQTADKITGTISFEDIRASRDPRVWPRLRKPTGNKYTLAARIQGRLQEDLNMSDEGSPDAAPSTAPQTNAESKPAEATAPAKPDVHVVFVSDIDVISSTFLQLRERPDDDFNWQFENVTFVLNVVDSLAKDDSLIEVRKRKIRHSTLKLVELETEKAREKTIKQSKEFEDEYSKKTKAFQAETQKAIEKLQAEMEELQKGGSRGDANTERSIQEKARRLIIERAIAEERLKKETDRLERERDQQLDQINYALRQDIKDVQSTYKTLAAFLPPIPPLVVALVVWIYRRMKESEGVVAERRR